jgi:hypothetical protein
MLHRRFPDAAAWEQAASRGDGRVTTGEATGTGCLHLRKTESEKCATCVLRSKWIPAASGESWLRLKADPAIVGAGRKKLLWAMWNVRNDFIFNKPTKPSFLQVIPLATHWIRMWLFL